MSIDFSEGFAIEAIRKYLKSLGQEGRVERFEKNLNNYPIKGLMINDTLFSSAIQLTDEVKDGENMYYDGVLVVPYRLWLMASDNRAKKKSNSSFGSEKDSCNEKTL